ncbi:WD40 domain-containing protein [Cephalotus follicularis]|uniref:WD40 domain-containing protein n=1 Tax=Cephalotus follicularis TaxID=3775 RepID=A0A1Q3C794_CEPFO|nr:WD40 domain-containing protein [Cephalotus follicularis]
MNCRSVACIWPGTPPPQRVTATAALDNPPTIYTGGSNGSILSWPLSDFNSVIKPIAMLCGHAAPIADLGVCNPVNTSNSLATSGNSGALVSACTDGVLCVWSRSSGHCRRRRKLPPWVGIPSIIRTLLSNPRYVCICCCFIDNLHLYDYRCLDSVEGVDKEEIGNRKPPKCSVVIVDTYTLTIVQTVFHGHLSIGPLKFMDIVQLSEERDKHSVALADSFGRLQLVSMSKYGELNGEGWTDLRKSSSQSEMDILAHGLNEVGQVVSIAMCRNIIAFVFEDHCIFGLLGTESKIGEISFGDNVLIGDFIQLHVMGGMFLEGGHDGNAPNTQEANEVFFGRFVVWNNRGCAIVYVISYFNDIFKCEPLCGVPAVCHPFDAKVLISFIQFNDFLIRIESVCSHVEEPLQWTPHVTIWSLNQQHNDHGKLYRQCLMLAEGGSFADWDWSSTSLKEIDGHGGGKIKSTSGKISIPSTENVNDIHTDDGSNGLGHKGRMVSSAMVISEIVNAPYAVVYGFFDGEIEVVQFKLFQGLDSEGGSPHPELNSHLTRQCFSGHTGAVLCLAAHRMLGAAKGWSFSHALVSGSMDCTVRIWDLDTGNLITVMHQHVAPVRQIILSPARTERPWSDCVLSVGEDSCVALASLETLRVERMFPGHPNYPAKVVWDGGRGYIACLCRNHSSTSDDIDELYIWDVKAGARERVIRGTASHSMFDHFCKGINVNSMSGTALNGNTSVSSLLLPLVEDGSFSQRHVNLVEKGLTMSNFVSSVTEPSSSQAHASKGNSGIVYPNTPFVLHSRNYPIKYSCPFPGIATLTFDLASLMFHCRKHDSAAEDSDKRENYNKKEKDPGTPGSNHSSLDNGLDNHGTSSEAREEHDWIGSLEDYLLRVSLSFLHLWNVDCELDKLLVTEMKLHRPDSIVLACGLPGDNGSLTLTFPGLNATLELWKSSSEFCAMRSLTMVSLAQRIFSLANSNSVASSALAAFYTRSFADKYPEIKPPSLQLLVSFWQDESEHVRMAARSLFHCSASRAIPLPLCTQKATDHAKLLRSLSGIEENEHENLDIGVTSTNGFNSDWLREHGISQVEESKLLAWLESYEVQDWISCVGGTSQDAMTSHIIVAAALAIWYPSLVKPGLASLVVHPLVKLVMAMNEKYSSTAAELLAEGMESTWKSCIGSEIPHMIGDVFFQIECVSGPSPNAAGQYPSVPAPIRETLVDVLLPSLAMADTLGFLTVIESQIWSTASDSPVHLISLMTLIRVVRGSPRNLAQYLDKVVSFILQTTDPANSVMRRTCLQSSMVALKEVVRVFPMVALNETLTRLAVGNAIGGIDNASICVYDMQSVAKIKVLDASGPPGLPSLIPVASETVVTTGISSLSFSPDGEGLVAFSEHGLMIRWWSLGSVWWEKLSRTFVPVQCTKLIFVPPWEGFSPNSSRTSIMASIMGHDKGANLQENAGVLNYAESFKLVIHNLDLSYRLDWVGERNILLTRHGHELGTFQL